MKMGLKSAAKDANNCTKHPREKGQCSTWRLPSLVNQRSTEYRGVLNVETRVQVAFHWTELSTDPGSDLGPSGQN